MVTSIFRTEMIALGHAIHRFLLVYTNMFSLKLKRPLYLLNKIPQIQKKNYQIQKLVWMCAMQMS